MNKEQSNEVDFQLVRYFNHINGRTFIGMVVDGKLVRGQKSCVIEQVAGGCGTMTVTFYLLPDHIPNMVDLHFYGSTPPRHKIIL